VARVFVVSRSVGKELPTNCQPHLQVILVGVSQASRADSAALPRVSFLQASSVEIALPRLDSGQGPTKFPPPRPGRAVATGPPAISSRGLGRSRKLVGNFVPNILFPATAPQNSVRTLWPSRLHHENQEICPRLGRSPISCLKSSRIGVPEACPRRCFPPCGSLRRRGARFDGPDDSRADEPGAGAVKVQVRALASFFLQLGLKPVNHVALFPDRLSQRRRCADNDR
jgi:hypothetical protein